MGNQVNKFSEQDRDIIINLVTIGYDHYIKGVLDVQKIKHRFSYVILMEVVERLIHDKEILEDYHDGIDGIDEYKIAGFLSYWVARLKPVVIDIDCPDVAAKYVNEFLAIAIAKNIYRNKFDHLPYITNSFRDNLLYSLRYRVITGRALSLIYESFVNGYSQYYKENVKKN